MYVDYLSKGTMTTVHEVVFTNTSMFFGKGAGSNRAFDGWIDEVRITPRLLEPAEFLHTMPVWGTLMGLR